MLNIQFELDNNILKKLCEEAEKDLFLSPAVLTQKALTEASLQLKWLKILTSAQEKIKVLKREKQTLIAEGIKNLKGAESNLPRAFKEKAMLDNPKIVEIEDLINEMIEIVGFLQGVYAIFAKFGFSIKNSTDLLKIEKSL